MGAYFFAASIDNRKMIKTYDFDSGAKLMEHSYIGNDYVSFVLEALAGGRKASKTEVEVPNWKGHKFVWLCDYHEDPKMSWAVYSEEEIKDLKKYDYNTGKDAGSKIYTPEPCLKNAFIINEDKMVFIDIKKYKRMLKKHGDPEERYPLFINPLPILANSDEDSMGGGDFHIEDVRRASWCGDRISVSYDRPSTYEDHTELSIFIEDEFKNKLYGESVYTRYVRAKSS